MSSLIDESVKIAVKQRFADLKHQVIIKVFSTKGHCLFCNEMLALVNSIAQLSDKIKVEVCQCDKNDPLAKKYNITDHPAISIEGDKDYRIRFYGVPAGKEFTSLIETIILVSNREATLSPQVKDLLKKINKKVNLKVFVTLDCPYCPAMVLRANKLALSSEFITTEMIESSQFAQLAMDYNIFGVPNTIINNGRGRVDGLVTEEALITEIINTLNRSGEKNPFT